MSLLRPDSWPFTANVLKDDDPSDDSLPASYHHSKGVGVKRHRTVSNPTLSLKDFLETELSLGNLNTMLQHLWFAGAKRPATRLHLQVAMGRKIAAADRLDLHLLWSNKGTIFIKPVPRFLLKPDFWRSNLACSDDCTCQKHAAMKNNGNSNSHPQPECKEDSRKIALGFLYTYACLISSETDFCVANDHFLLPRKADGSTIEWTKWKLFFRELINAHDTDSVHPRFHRAELRLSRINIIHYLTRFPIFDPYLRGWYNYSSFFHDNLTWMVTIAVFIALALTAMQVGLATDQLKNNNAFQRASYGFTVFAILGPICAIGLIGLAALFNLIKDLPWLIANRTSGIYATPPAQKQTPPA